MGLVSRFSLAGLEIDFFLPEHVTARRNFGGRVCIRNTKAFLPSFSVHLSGATGSVLNTVYFPVIPGRALIEETVEVCFDRRGIYRESGFQFRPHSPSVFWNAAADVTLRREVLATRPSSRSPASTACWLRCGAILNLKHEAAAADLYRIRPYEALESARHVVAKPPRNRRTSGTRVRTGTGPST